MAFACRRACAHAPHSQKHSAGDEFTTQSVLTVVVTVLFVIASRVLLRRWLSASNKDRLTVKQLYVYPVKSCAGVCVDSWPLGRRGLLCDRNWMIVGTSAAVARTLGVSSVSDIALVPDTRC